ncbi:MAG TPA: hypothetical protein ENN03_10905 [bacterium]|nr:hypothetical protein [bacterium]
MDYSFCCAQGAKWEERRIDLGEGVALKVIDFTPARKTVYPDILFVAGWISLIQGWQEVLREMTRDFRVLYVETREKVSARAPRRAGFGVEAIGQDLIRLVESLDLPENGYVCFGSSLGATAILDACSGLTVPPRCLVLVAPNAVFRIPWFGRILIRLFYPGFYILLKPFIKWYLKVFRLNTRADYAQYEKYGNALDAADPWRLKRAARALETYSVWPILKDIGFPALIIGASRDRLHEPENLKRMARMMKNARYFDMETNRRTHSADMVRAVRCYLSNLEGA